MRRRAPASHTHALQLIYTGCMLHHRSAPVALAALALLASTGAWGCSLRVRDAWIREPPPGVTTLAGYAVLSNAGALPLTVRELRSSLFARIQMHESMLQQGMAMMRPLASVTVAAGGSVRFEPDGKHFMLMQPTRALHSGEHVAIDLIDADGCTTTASFVVSRDPPPQS